MLLHEGGERVPSGCAISAILDTQGGLFSGQEILQSIALMHERSNGLGGGFAAYGIYPDYPDFYALHVFYDSPEKKEDTERYIDRHFNVEMSGKIPTRKHPRITSVPLVWRYFVKPDLGRWELSGLSEEEYIARCVMHINSDFEGAYVFSSGKNMGAFKGVGYPEDIGEFYRLDELSGYSWTAHGRFPTNTPGWWGGAHPFTLLDFAVVHNGEISSYDANRRFVEMFNYSCSLMTDTEVMTYLFDLLLRKHHLPIEWAAATVAAPTWDEIDAMPPEEKKLLTTLRAIYSGALINGPFSIVLSFSGGLMALNDRLKLRSLVAAQHGNRFYCASEESAIRVICPQPDKVWAPRGGEPVIVRVQPDIQLANRRV